MESTGTVQRTVFRYTTAFPQISTLLISVLGGSNEHEQRLFLQLFGAYTNIIVI